MFSNKILFFLKNILFLIFILSLLQSCGALKFKRSDVKKTQLTILKKEKEISKKEEELQ